jgi:dTDP-4-amino-4,6-dideoxygalactose transaminase
MKEKVSTILEKLDTILEKWEMTQEQYDEFLSRLEQGNPIRTHLHTLWSGDIQGFHPKFEELSEEKKAQIQAQMREKLDTILEKWEMTQEQYNEFLSRLEQGNPIRTHLHTLWSGDIQGFHPKLEELSEEKKAQIQAQHKEQLAQDLATGKISQEQHDTILTHLETFTFPMMKRGRQHENYWARSIE